MMEEEKLADNAELNEKLKDYAKRVIEALLFATNTPLTLKKIRKVTDEIAPFQTQDLIEMLSELKESYDEENRAFSLEEIGNGFLLKTKEEYQEHVSRLFQTKKVEGLSQAALEVLSIIAYKQPITKPEIEAIRGVDCSGILQSLIDRLFVEAAGQKEVPGRPNLYGVTKEFLYHFGIKNVDQLKAEEAERLLSQLEQN